MGTKVPDHVREAAETFERVQARVESEWADDLRQLDAAKKTLRAFFEEHPDRKQYRRVVCKTTVSATFSRDRAVELGYLDDAKIAACRTATERRTLVLAP